MMVVKMIQVCLYLLAIDIFSAYVLIGANVLMYRNWIGGVEFEQLMTISVFIYLLLILVVIILTVRHWIDTGEKLEQLKRVEYGSGKDSFNQIISQLSRDQ